MINSTFGSFNIARLGMAVAQKGLSITGQNISNISTEGYTRQRLDQVSLNVGGGSNRYASIYNTNIGNGALVTGLSQVRDPFLDKRFRVEMAQVGEYDARLDGLNELKNILDEASKVDKDGNGGGILNALHSLFEAFDQLGEHVGSKEYDSMVKAEAQGLVELFNSYAKQIDNVRLEQESDLTDIDIPEINNIINNIKELNKSIKNSHIHGNEALELQDERNMLIDELSTYLNIEVVYDNVQLTQGLSIDELNINIVGKDGKKIPLIEDEEARQLNATKDADGKWTLELTDLESGDLMAKLDKIITVAKENLEIQKNAVSEAQDAITKATAALDNANVAFAPAEAEYKTAQTNYNTAKKAAEDAKRHMKRQKLIQQLQKTHSAH